jgi:hypothetical protein
LEAPGLDLDVMNTSVFYLAFGSDLLSRCNLQLEDKTDLVTEEGSRN